MNFDIKDFKNPNLKDLDEYRHMYEKSVTDPSSFFLEHALKELDWFEKPSVGYSAGTLSLRHLTVASATSSTVAACTWSRPGVTIFGFNMVPEISTS